MCPKKTPPRPQSQELALSILKLTNRHVWQDSECAHGPLLNLCKTWIEENSPVMK